MTNNRIEEENLRTRDKIAMVLMLVAALGALFSFITAVGTASSAGPDTQQVEWWRALGYLFFAFLFTLLAFWPRRYPFLWEIIILNKAVLTIVMIMLIQNNAANAATAAVADGILTIILLAAYLLGKGYLSWRGSTQRRI
jgi:cell division protein FtsW (lipid II flippase)